MVKIFRKLQAEYVTNQLEKINQELSLEQEYLDLYKEDLEKKKDKKLTQKRLQMDKKLYPLELQTKPRVDAIELEKQEALRKFEKKKNLELLAAKQTKKRMEKKSSDVAKEQYAAAIEKLEAKTKAFITSWNLRIEAAQEFDDALTEDDYAAFQEMYESKNEQLTAKYEEVKEALEEKLLKSFASEKEKNKKHIAKLQTKKEKYEATLQGLLENVPTHELPDGVILRLDNLLMQFGGLKAVDNLSFDVKKGEIFGLIGPNGAGKTTVFNCITQFYKNYIGQIYYRDYQENVIKLDDQKVFNVIKHGIVRTFQNVELIWELSVLDNLLVAAHSMYKSSYFDHFIHSKRYRREEQVIKAKALKVLEYLDLLPYQYAIPYGLPYGILKRIELARTLMSNPRLIILDEPAAGLNDKETQDLARIILQIRKEFDVTIFLVEHDMSLVMDICDTVCAISFGKKLAIGSPEDIQSNATVQEAYLGGE